MQEQHKDLTASQWQVIEKIIDNKRKRKICLKTVFSACLWLTRTGCQCGSPPGRNLAQTKYPAWQTVAYYFYKWQKDGTWQQCLESLSKQERERQKRITTPSRVAVDSQTGPPGGVKQSGCFSGQVGVDGHKKIDGRKRHLAVDSLGLPWAIYVGAADEQDGIAGLELMPQLAKVTSRLSLICADKAYKGSFVYDAAFYGWQVEISQKPPSVMGFIPQKGRWQVERSFGWLNHYRRLSKDYERTTESAVCFIQLAFITIILSKKL